MADHENRSGGSERPARSGDRPAPGDLTINQPDVAAEVTDCFDAYDNALIANDVAALDRWFWAAPQAVRYGLGEELYGYDAIAQHRRNLPGGVIRGPLTRQTVTTFGTDMAIVCAVGENLRADPTLFTRAVAALDRIPLRLVSQAASRRNITFVLRDADVPEAMNRLHGAFFS